METREALHERVSRERQLIDRLMAAIHFTDAQIERAWAISSAHQSGLSIRRIAAATLLNPSRVHQVLNTAETTDMPTWLVDGRGYLRSGSIDLRTLRRQTERMPDLHDRFRKFMRSMVPMTSARLGIAHGANGRADTPVEHEAENIKGDAALRLHRAEPNRRLALSVPKNCRTI